MTAKQDAIAAFLKRIRIRRVVQEYTGKEGLRKYASFMADYVEGGQRRRKKFKTEAAAKTWARKFAAERADGRDVLDLAPDRMRDALAALKVLAEGGGRLGSLEDAVRAALKYAPAQPAGGDKPLGGAVAEYLAAAVADGLRPRSVESLTSVLNRFADSFPRATVREAARESDAWLRGLTDPAGRPYAALTMRHYRTVLGGFFGWCVDREWLPENPARAPQSRRGRRMIVAERAPGILTPEQAAKVLRVAEDEAPEIVPAIAVCLFAGLRRAEIERLRWGAVNMEAGILTVGAEVAKVRQIRTVELSDALRAWLLPFRRRGGPVVPEGIEFEKVFRRVRHHAGMAKTWPANGLRHSAASYMIARDQNAAAVALTLGHSVNVLLRHYRGLVTPQQAADFWALRPSESAGKVVRIAAGEAS